MNGENEKQNKSDSEFTDLNIDEVIDDSCQSGEPEAVDVYLPGGLVEIEPEKPKRKIVVKKKPESETIKKNKPVQIKVNRTPAGINPKHYRIATKDR